MVLGTQVCSNTYTMGEELGAENAHEGPAKPLEAFRVFLDTLWQQQDEAVASFASEVPPPLHDPQESAAYLHRAARLEEGARILQLITDAFTRANPQGNRKPRP